MMVHAAIEDACRIVQEMAKMRTANRYVAWALVACFGLGYTALASSPAKASGVKTSIVVAPTEWETTKEAWFGEAEQKAFEEQLAQGLDATGGYRIVDVDDLTVVEGTEDKKGGVRGAQLLIGCHIEKAKKTEQKGKKVNVLGLGGSQKVRSTYEMELAVSLFNTRTQMELTAATVKVKKTYEDTSRNVDIAGLKFKKDRTYSDKSTLQITGDLVAEAVKVIDQKVRDYGWRSSVKGVVNGKPIIMGGTRDGLAVGMEFDVIEQSEPLIDDDTGEILDEGDETKVGRLRVAQVKEKVSYCQSVSGRDAAKGDIVRLDTKKKSVSAPASAARTETLAANR